jgi:hypothetical protein
MNVLILTPDAVGSTLLQRMLTIYMQFHEFDRPVINLHELTNGLEKYYSPEFNQEIVGKSKIKTWGYHQSLETIVGLLSSVDHYKTSRLAHYHLVQRNDTLADQIPFYNYLNDNFYIISCRRTNVFEHALSMTLNHVTKKFNVYNVYEKIDTFYELYRSGINLDVDAFTNQLNAYKQYIRWSDRYFNVSSYFNYEQDIPRLEEYILNLPVFSNQLNRITWEQNFGLSLNSWNKMHYARSDLGSLMIEQNTKLNTLMLEQSDIASYQKHMLPHWPSVSTVEEFNNLPAKIKHEFAHQKIYHSGVISLLDQSRQQQLEQCVEGYNKAQKTIDQMIKLGIVISGPPIKKQTLSEKQKIIKNFEQLLEIYNQWIAQHPSMGQPLTENELNNKKFNENHFWKNISSTGLATLN